MRHIMMLLKQQQAQFQPASWRHVYFLLMSVIYLGCIPREVTPLFLTRGAASPANESITIQTGGTLSMNCSASDTYLQKVWWGKSTGSENITWLTLNAIVQTNDTRVSIATRSFHNHSTFYLQITDITKSDTGIYECRAEWGGAQSFGYIFVSVQYFPAENPICATNGSDEISTESIAVWCDAAIGNPDVTITWRVDNSDKEVTGSVYSTEPPQNERVRSVVKLGEHLQNQVLVCTVTSSAFPGQNRSCSIGPTVLNTATTPVAGPLTYTTVRAIYESSPDVVTVSAAVAIPSFILLLVALLMCLLKRRRRRPGANGRGTDSGTTTNTGRSNYAGGRICGAVIATPMTQMSHHGNGRTTGAVGDAFDSPCKKVELDHPLARSSASAEEPGKDGLGQNTCVIYQTVHPEDSDCDTSSCESDSLHQERVINSYNDNVVTIGNNDELEASPAGSDECDGKMFDNPIYESYDDEYPSHPN